MNWLLNIFDNIKWKIEDAIWAIQDKIQFNKELKDIKIQLNKELKDIDAEWDKIKDVEEIEVKPKKKKVKKKSVRKAKKSV
jgi:hypothetical protein